MLYPSGIYNYFFVFIIFCAISRAQQQQQTKKLGFGNTLRVFSFDI